MGMNFLLTTILSTFATAISVSELLSRSSTDSRLFNSTVCGGKDCYWYFDGDNDEMKFSYGDAGATKQTHFELEDNSCTANCALTMTDRSANKLYAVSYGDAAFNIGNGDYSQTQLALTVSLTGCGSDQNSYSYNLYVEGTQVYPCLYGNVTPTSGNSPAVALCTSPQDYISYTISTSNACSGYQAS